MKYNRVFRTLIVAVIIALLVVVIPVTPTSAQTPFLSVSPYSGPVGTTVTVSGQNFNPFTNPIVHIFFDSTYVAITSVLVGGTFTAYFDVPSFTTLGTHYVTARDSSTYAGSTQLAIAYFTVTARQITITPTSGYVGSTVTVSGGGFNPSSTVTIYFDTAAIGTVTATANGSFSGATFAVPESYRGTHTIKGRDATGDSPGVIFTTLQKITVSPTSGTVGAEVTVSGNGFQASKGITITFAGSAVTTSPAAITTNSEGSFNASFSVPAGAGGTHEVKASDGTNEDGQAFTVSATASISQTEGYLGDMVTFSGSGFQAQKPITVTFYNENVATAPTDIYGNFSLSFTVPPLTAGTYLVKVSDGINTKEAYFEIHTSASISPVTSAALPGHVGTDVTVSGIGFIAGRTVTINYDGTQVATATVNTDGTFSAPFKAPVSAGGEHGVIATDGTITQQLTFLMESTPPSTLYPQLPLMDSKLEKWRFDWCGDATDLTKEVTDLSLPITYTLQVATEEDFSLGSLVLEKTGLTESEYTITKEERLKSVSKETPYYWRVKAIDAASNESQWSSPGSFYVGFTFSMPQPVIYTLFGVGALLLGFLGFWIGRKTGFMSSWIHQVLE